MKKSLSLLLCVFSISLAAAQNTQPPYLWPIKDAEPGTGMVCTPRSFIEEEMNFEHLFITAPEGTEIVSPVEGTISSIDVIYQRTLYGLKIYGDSNSNFDERIAKIAMTLDDYTDSTYLTGSLVISSGGKRIYISGLRGTQELKEGQKIEKGAPLGTIGHSYRKFNQPTIMLSVSKGGKPEDPMTPFGLETTFLPPGQQVERKLTLTKDEAKEDLNVYLEAVREIYPGLYDLMSKEDFDVYVKGLMTEIDSHTGDIGIVDFHNMIKLTLATIHDTHLRLFRPKWLPETKEDYNSKIAFGWIDGVLICTNAVPGLENNIGREIGSINGLIADSVKQIITSRIRAYDGLGTGYIDYRLVFASNDMWYTPFIGENRDLQIVWADGELTQLAGQKATEKWPYVYKQSGFTGGRGFNTKILNDSTAYLELRTFHLNADFLAKLENFIDSVSHMPNLIIDVRVNSGGEPKVLRKVFSYIAQDTLRLDGYSRVNKRVGLKVSSIPKTILEKPKIYSRTSVKSPARKGTIHINGLNMSPTRKPTTRGGFML